MKSHTMPTGTVRPGLSVPTLLPTDRKGSIHGSTKLSIFCKNLLMKLFLAHFRVKSGRNLSANSQLTLSLITVLTPNCTLEHSQEAIRFLPNLIVATPLKMLSGQLSFVMMPGSHQLSISSSGSHSKPMKTSSILCLQFVNWHV